MKKTIGILGPIGTFMVDGKLVQGVQTKNIVSWVSSFGPELKELTVEYATLGGDKDTGKEIYNYLMSIQPAVKVISKQIGPIGSVGTIMWFSGNPVDGRIALEGSKFIVHNPWIPNVSGDRKVMQNAANTLQASEEEMLQFYCEQTGITKEGLRPLMAAETSFDASEAVRMKFATSTYTALKQAAYFMETKNENEGIMAQLLAFLKNGKPGGPLASVAPPAELMGKPVTVDGKPALDGVYTVIGGVVTALAAAPDATAAPAAPGAQASAAPVAVVKADEGKLVEILATIKAQPTQESILAAVGKVVDEKITGLKKQIGTQHTPLGYTPETKEDDAKEYDKIRKENKLLALKREDPERWKRLHFARWGKMPV